MSILANQYYTNNHTPLWLGAGSTLYGPALIATTSGTVEYMNQYIFASNGTVIMQADTDSLITGYSYLCNVVLKLQLVGNEDPLPTFNIPLDVAIYYQDSDSNVYDSGAMATYVNDIRAGQYYLFSLSLPFIYKGGNPIMMNVTNVSSTDFQVNFTIMSESIIQTSPVPTSNGEFNFSS